MPTFEELEHNVNRSIDKRLNKFARLVKDELDIDLKNVDSDDLRKIKRSLNRLINKAGLNELSGLIVSFFDEVEKVSFGLLATDTAIDLKLINEIAIDRAEIIAQIGLDSDMERIESDLKKRFRKKLKVKDIKKLSKSEIPAFVDGLLKMTKAQTETAVTTAVMGYDRAVTTVKANDLGLHKFKYTGVKDGLNRDFCRDRAGNIYYDSEAKRWRNGQKEPASIYLGGYNCRHRKVYQVD